MLISNVNLLPQDSFENMLCADQNVSVTLPLAKSLKFDKT